MWTKAILIKLWAILALAGSVNAHGALTVDRSRLILNQGEKSISLNVTNRNEKDPYLAQGWMEDVDGKKISGPLMVLPPVQRVEAGGKTLVRIQVLPASRRCRQTGKAFSTLICGKYRQNRLKPTS